MHEHLKKKEVLKLVCLIFHFNYIKTLLTVDYMVYQLCGFFYLLVFVFKPNNSLCHDFWAKIHLYLSIILYNSAAHTHAQKSHTEENLVFSCNISNIFKIILNNNI